MVRMVLRGTHDVHSPLYGLHKQFRLLERIVKDLLSADTMVEQLLAANPHTTTRLLRRGLRLNLDGSIAWWSLERCELSALPDWFGNLRTTGHLLLSHNNLQSLPESFASIVIGGHLTLDYNPLRLLPMNFADVTVGGDLWIRCSSLLTTFAYLPHVCGHVYWE